MKLTVIVDDGDDSSKVVVNLGKTFPPYVHEIRLIQSLLEQAGTEVTLARLIAGAASLGIDVYAGNHFRTRVNSLKKKFLEKLSENPQYKE